jgi:glycogen debranching enzyme
MSSFVQACKQVLLTNDRGTYTVPSPRLYPHQWAWDSAFVAIGWAHIDPQRAWQEITTLLDHQWQDGRVPHIIFHQASTDYWPGPDFWETERTSAITQPPVWASAVRKIVEISQDISRLEQLVPRIDASHRFFYEQRDPLNFHLVAVAHPWESGMDNSPAWDGPLSAIDPSKSPPLKRRDIKIVTDTSMRPTDDTYRRYAVIVKDIAKAKFGPGTFMVYDPMMSAVLARAEDDLAWLAGKIGVQSDAAQRASKIKDALVRHLWDDAHGRFSYFDAMTRKPIHSDVIGCYLPLWAGVEPRYAERLLQNLRERYWTHWPLPSTCPNQAGFEPRRYWRGPAWVPVNWMLVESLGTPLLQRTLQLVRDKGFWEYFEPFTGEGLGGDTFAWTAALALDMHHRYERTAQ